MNNTTKYILIAIILLLLIYILAIKNKSRVFGIQMDCYSLPDNSDPSIFGPPYWAAFHDLAHKVPCPTCRTFAEKFMVFFHDVVNKKLDKPIYDKQNYDDMKQYLLTN